MKEDNSNISDNSNLTSSFHQGIGKSSIFVENELFLSSIIDSSPEENPLKEQEKESEKKEIPSSLNHKLKFDITILHTTDLQLRANLPESLFDKIKRIMDNQEDDDEDLYLQIKDYQQKAIAESFFYNDAIDEIYYNIPDIEKELQSFNIKYPKKENIFEIKSIESMVEQTNGFDQYLKNHIIEEICFLKKYFSTFRKNLHDGNSFYRCIMFSWLEYLIFNKKIDVIKYLISQIHLKFNREQEYIHTKELPPYLKKQFITDEVKVIKILLEIIVQFLVNNKIEEAYLTLLKAYNSSNQFDKIMIFYLRYSIYEFILENEDKLYSKENKLLFGNFLPSKYENKEGKFLYKKYFMEDLFKYFNNADKLSIYLVPMILKINLNIVFYYHGAECEILNHYISCGLKNKSKENDTINLLYKKEQFDIIYTNKFYSQNKSLLEMYIDQELQQQGNDYFIVSKKEIEEKKKLIDEINPFSSENNTFVLFNRQIFDLLQKEKPEDNTNSNSDEEKKEENKKDKNIVFEKKIVSEHNETKCFICLKNLGNQNLNSVLPCACKICFCSEICKNNYITQFCNFIRLMPFEINIKCGRCQNHIQRISLIKNIDTENQLLRSSMKNKLFEFFQKYCMNCITDISNKKNNKKLRCKCIPLAKILEQNKFDHFICHDCHKNGVSGNCKICDFYHSKLADH